MVKAVLCDIDGTLVDSNWLHAEAWQRTFAEMGIMLDREDVRRQHLAVGDATQQLTRAILLRTLDAGEMAAQLLFVDDWSDGH